MIMYGYKHLNTKKLQYLSSHLQNLCWSKMITVMSVLLIIFHSANSSLICGSSIRSAGETIPRGDIILEYNSGVPLEITCILDPDNAIVQSQLLKQTDDEHKTKLLSQRILFYKYEERVSDQYVSIINNTAARLRIPNHPPGVNIYSCILLLDNNQTLNEQPFSLKTSAPSPVLPQETGVCLNTVYVGYKPLHITNFSCISNNWINLKCKWTKPENPLPTKYKLFFRLPGRMSNSHIYSCSSNSDIENNTCYWDGTTQPIYRQLYEYYYFTITGENALGTTTSSFRFHHYANVIPDSPNITVLEVTQSSAMLRWSVGIMISFPRELIHKIEYRSQWDSSPEHWHSINVNLICNSSLTSEQTILVPKVNCLKHDSKFYYFNVTDLEHPFTHYDFRIFVRSSIASEEDMWSAPGQIALTTRPTIPRRPPQTFIGGYESVQSSIEGFRDVFIYWQNIDDSEKCGDSFEYFAYYTSISADNKTIIHRSDETHDNCAKFKELYTNTEYLFAVYSSNTEGFSTEYSTVYVPSEADKIEFDKVINELINNQKISTDDQQSDYSIF
ncbi:cytokine receptor-like [Sipha flava]|uniref:Cytokine receptor n=1 Tax=Sipha flava TaxID=143950 RepID=A0A2S2R920_9HEMI|nr:cytokine receptor-like [Sipha flava]